MNPRIKSLQKAYRPRKLRKNVQPKVASLCYRVKGEKLQVLLITSRGTGRWIVPKGWLIKGMSDADAALREAWEEAGVVGSVSTTPIGKFSYRKIMEDGSVQRCQATVYPIEVKKLKASFPERGQRRVMWVSPKKAAGMVREKGLRKMFKALAGGYGA